MPSLALSDLIGAPVYDPSGTSPVGKVREVALSPQDDPNRVSGFVVKTRQGVRLLGIKSVESVNGGVRADTLAADWTPLRQRRRHVAAGARPARPADH